MKKIILWLIFIFAIVALALVCLTVALWNSWSLWVGAAIFISVLLGLWIVRFVWKNGRIWYQRSKTEQLNKTVASDVSVTLSEKWKEALKVLKRSSLQHNGNPVYALPWYMVMGHTNSGKASALARAWAESPLKKMLHKAATQKTVNINWWYFDKAVVLDTSSRYIVQEENSGSDSDKEWEQLLNLLKRTRSKEGLNGLILTISAKTLLSSDTKSLAEQAQVIRVRIEDLMQLFNRRFPIYLLVTQCDVIYGMEPWCQALSKDVWKQAIGYVGDADNRVWPYTYTSDEATFVDMAFEHVGKKISQLRFILMQRDMHQQINNTESVSKAEEADDICSREHDRKKRELACLLFPNELLTLQEPLKDFLRHALGKSTYLESPFLRGLFLSSALQPGGSVSKIFEMAHSAIKKEAGYQGFFLQDVFNRVLPMDRYLHRPTLVARKSRVRRHYYALAIWISTVLLAIGYLSISFVDQLGLLNQIKMRYPENTSLTGHFAADIRSTEKVHRFINWLEREKQDKNSYFAFNRHPEEIEQRLKASYATKFKKYIIPEWDQALDTKIATLMQAKQSEQIAGYVQMLVRRINLVQARVNGADSRSLSQMPPISAQLINDLVPELSADLSSRFNSTYISALAWMADDLGSLYRLDALRSRLNKIALTSNNLQWLVNWADSQSDLLGVSAHDFWGNVFPLNHELTIPAAFTREGKARMDAFIDEVRKSEPDLTAFDTKWQVFNQWYAQERLRLWYAFITQFGQDEWQATDSEMWRQSLLSLTGERNPYLLLMQRLAVEFDDLSQENLPSWLVLNKHLLSLYKLSLQNKVIEESAAVMNIGSKWVKSLAQINTSESLSTKIAEEMAAINRYKNFNIKLSMAINTATTSPAKAVQLAANFHGFANNPSVQSELQDSYTQFTDLQRLVKTDGSSENHAIWTLVSRPLIQTARYADIEASCVLQQQWETQVAGPAHIVENDPELLTQFYADNGSIATFLTGSAKPYIARTLNGYRAVETMGLSVPFYSDFFAFANAMTEYQGKQKITKQRKLLADQRTSLEMQMDQQQLQENQQQLEQRITELQKNSDKLTVAAYPIKIAGLPTDVNQGAKFNVVSTLLKVACEGSDFNLHNLNFSVSGNFNWSPQLCGNTTLEIRFPGFTLIKHYPFTDGFLAFVRDFRNGTHTFTVSDFPADREKIEQMGIHSIVVRYQLSGTELALKNNNLLSETNLALAKAKNDVRNIGFALLRNKQQVFQNKIQDVNLTIPTIKIPQRIGQCWSNTLDQ